MTGLMRAAWSRCVLRSSGAAVVAICATAACGSDAFDHALGASEGDPSKRADAGLADATTSGPGDIAWADDDAGRATAPNEQPDAADPTLPSAGDAAADTG